MMQMWNGEDLRGKSLYVIAEQGVGDEILYASMIPDLLARGANVTWECDARLTSLFGRSFPTVGFVPRGMALSHACDYFLHAGSLGRVLRRELRHFPTKRGYLVPGNLQSYEHWNDLPDGSIGISWSSTNPKVAARKTVPLDQWAPILHLDRPFVALQEGGGPTVWRTAIDTRNDIDGLAAVISACSAVVTVSNSVAHLAGALGVPTHVMVPSGIGRFWYWGYEGEKTLWYPSVAVHRQVGDDWGPAVRSVARRLAA